MKSWELILHWIIPVTQSDKTVWTVWLIGSGVTTVVAATAVLWGPAGLGGPGPTRINYYEHSHSATMN